MLLHHSVLVYNYCRCYSLQNCDARLNESGPDSTSARVCFCALSPPRSNKTPQRSLVEMDSNKKYETIDWFQAIVNVEAPSCVVVFFSESHAHQMFCGQCTQRRLTSVRQNKLHISKRGRFEICAQNCSKHTCLAFHGECH